MNATDRIQGLPFRDPQALEAPKQDRHQQLVGAARQFEKIFAGMMVKGMRESGKVAGGAGIFGEGPGSDTYSDWFDNLLSDRLSANGGLGLQTKLIKQWERTEASEASKNGNKTKVDHDVA